MNRMVSLLIVMLLAAGTLFAQQRDTLAVRDTVAGQAVVMPVTDPGPVTETVPGMPMTQADSLIAYARTFIGKPYKLGAEGPFYYDCSSFVRAAFRGIGIELPRHTMRQIQEGEGVCEGVANVDQQEIRRGDIVLFGKRVGGIKEVGHVGIVVDVDLEHSDFTFIHCGVAHGVEIQKFSNPYYLMRYITCRRIIP